MSRCCARSGRQVRKGEKALTLCMPITIKKKDETRDHHADVAVFTRFVYKARWFVLSQTEGEPIAEPEIPSWDADRALAALNIEQIPFDRTDGNCLGYARDRSIAINPVNPSPHKTRFHELAHVLLGHTAEGAQADTEITPRSLRECEAEAVALVCCAALDLPGVAECRGYIQSWWGQEHEIPERSAQRVLKVTDQTATSEPPWSTIGWSTPAASSALRLAGLRVVDNTRRPRCLARAAVVSPIDEVPPRINRL